MTFADFFTSFVLGLLTPLTAVCVLPLYPGFLAYLAGKIGEKSSRKQFLKLGLVVVLGVMVFMFLLGLIFTTILEVSLTNVIGIVSPIAFGVLGIISIFLIFDYDLGKFFPQMHAPVLKNPLFSAFVFGFFFGAIVIPCNPLFIAALFTKSISNMGFISNMANFIAFGFGIGLPLLVFSAISYAKSSAVIGFLAQQKKKINLVAGIIMLVISIYYLVFVFRVIG